MDVTYTYNVGPIINEVKKLLRDLDRDAITREVAGERLRDYAVMLEATRPHYTQPELPHSDHAATDRIRDTWRRNRQNRSIDGTNT